MLPEWLKFSGVVILSSMLAWYYLKTKVLIRAERKSEMRDNKIRLDVEGMTCMHCAGSVKKAVGSINGTSDIIVDLDNKCVEFEIIDPVNVENVKSAITSAGYNLIS